MAQATFSVRMDETLKKQFDQLCSDFGMNASTAINVFARAVVRERKIPFEIASPQPEITREKAMQALRWERKIEMALEGHRWYDLARWGIIADELNSFASYEKQYLLKYANSVYNPKWCVLPIPLNEIQKMDGLLVQNENWK